MFEMFDVSQSSAQQVIAWLRSTSSANTLRKCFCHFPFTLAEIHPTGNVFLCCPTWSGNRSIGNIFKDSPDQLWNSVEAQSIRAGIITGSFSKCERHICPEIVAGTLPLRDKTDPQRIFLDRGPETVKLCHDNTCNLSCPSCRTEMIVANRERQSQLDRILHEFILPFLKDTKWLFLAGDGDPFASRHYREILWETAVNASMRIKLHTNAILCDERAWDDCRLHGRTDEVLVSIDAATPETYAVVRRGGDFARLRRNLEFLAKLRAAGEIKQFTLAFVVQAINFREMPAFVRLGKDLRVDRVGFSRIQHWPRGMTDVQFREAQVWREDHPLRRELSAVLRDPILTDPIAHLGNVLIST
jgi:wyosine [tRNA(Phe)-imidazoG37] synthetase (radical SAM superfamily)